MKTRQAVVFAAIFIQSTGAPIAAPHSEQSSAASPDQGVRGMAHFRKEPVVPRLRIAQYRAMQLAPLNIRPATGRDIPRLLALYHHLIPDDDPADEAAAAQAFARFLAYPGSAIFLGEAEGALVASCVLVVVPNLTRRARPYGLIENVVTHGACRRRGYGRQILDAATDAAWSAGCYKVMLLTGSTAPETLRFYQRAGFEPSKTGFQKRAIPVRPEG
jgi:GNAT superfamily N-acetyltransferase